MMGLPHGEKKFENRPMFTRFDTIQERDRRTDRRMDGHRTTAEISLYVASASRGINCQQPLNHMLFFSSFFMDTNAQTGSVVRGILRECFAFGCEPFNGHINTAEQRTIIHQYGAGTLAVDGWAAALPRPLLSVPNVTAHPPTAIVPTSYYSMWQLPLHCKVNVKEGHTQERRRNTHLP